MKRPDWMIRPEREKVWWATITNVDTMEIALSFLRGMMEEVILARRTCKIELAVDKTDVQQPASNIPLLAGETS